ncbi:MAG: hypothetical protein CW341_00835 [Bacteroidetes bacterium]|nr:hypothetical protein [Bacteroidota bacterium]
MSAQEVTNITVQQIEKNILISYDLDKKANIMVYISTNGGKSFEKLHEVSGDVGKNVSAGHNTIVYYGNMISILTENIVFDVRSTKQNKELNYKPKGSYQKTKYIDYKRNPYVFFTVNAAYNLMPQYSFGIKIGQGKTIGWFFSAMSNFNFKGAYTPFPDETSYELTGKLKTVRFSGQLGLVVRPITPISILLGVGYGYSTRCYQTINNEWFCSPKHTNSGVDASLGLLFNMSGFASSLEFCTTNFKTFEIRVGLGFCISY